MSQAITITNDTTYTYFSGSGFDPHDEVFAQINSQAVSPNESTEGVGAALHKTSDASGNVRFRVPTDFLLPDLPREVKATMRTEFASVTQTFPE